MEAFPLTWPANWPRVDSWKRTRARFGTRPERDMGRGRLSIAEGTLRVRQALKKMGFREPIISSNLALRNDGLPRSGQSEPRDCGVAVYWGSGKSARCIAVDCYDRVADNLGAIAATLEAMRAIERHGGAAILARAFVGFTALPAPEQPWQVLGVSATATRGEIDGAYRQLARQHHPDRGGDAAQMARVNAARDHLYSQHGWLG